MTRLRQKSLHVLPLLSDCDSVFEAPQKYFKVTILCVLLHNTFLTRTNMPAEIIIKCLLFLKVVTPKKKKKGSCLIYYNKKLWRRCRISGIFHLCFKQGTGHWGPPVSLKHIYPECWRGGEPTPINDDAAKWHQDIINDRPNTSGSKLVVPSLHSLTGWEGTEFLLTEEASTEGARHTESLIIEHIFFKERTVGWVEDR